MNKRQYKKLKTKLYNHRFGDYRRHLLIRRARLLYHRKINELYTDTMVFIINSRRGNYKHPVKVFALKNPHPNSPVLKLSEETITSTSNLIQNKFRIFIDNNKHWTILPIEPSADSINNLHSMLEASANG